MNSERRVYVPAVTIDVAEMYLNCKNENERWLHRQRLEATRDFCNEVLATTPKTVVRSGNTVLETNWLKKNMHVGKPRLDRK